MSKKKLLVDTAALTPKKTPTPRKPKAKASADSKIKKTILSAPQALQLEAANSFMRTKAFTLQNKVRTAMTGINKIEKSESKMPSASVQPSSQDPFRSKSSHRFKFAFLGLLLAGAIAGYFYSDRVMDGFKSVSGTASPVEEKTEARMREETVVPVNDQVPAAATAKATDVIPTEMPTAVPAPKVAEQPKAVKAAPKAVKKGKATRTKTAKAKAKAKSKVAHK